ncbi:GGDEF domain-containing response regulator [Marinomonas posidonica]|uniref:diguanylate cyclase n=1 Tax=Marinomonas posidonica (strain CECT 7376 / NCIMB 14433 / IVIA-Po-181) TaxID=491952 RepID=F6CRV0_MARPP|nr:diguanylate cyclase [Marinomonas posidonica]AEF54953.1 response regulator receiver modulated diguanylate cyclase [Marinomonas posidonica IVIA-Po-181]
MKVLIADDTNTDRLLLKLHLAKLGCQVIEAKNGQEAVSQYSAHLNEIDLILIDVQMPKLNGFEAVKAIREVQQQNKQEWFPVIFLSASANEKDVEDGIMAGGDDYLIKPISQKVLAAKMHAMKRISDMRSRLVESNKMLESLASTDYLTGIANRRFFEVSLERVFDALTNEGDTCFACGILDLDKFKDINDSFGHDIGDKVLIDVASLVQEHIAENDLFGRLGGEEFGLVLVSESREGLIQRFETIQKRIEDYQFVYTGQLIEVTASIGVVAVSDECKTRNQLLKRADKLLYQAKTSGRNQVCYDI